MLYGLDFGAKFHLQSLSPPQNESLANQALSLSLSLSLFGIFVRVFCANVAGEEVGWGWFAGLREPSDYKWSIGHGVLPLDRTLEEQIRSGLDS